MTNEKPPPGETAPSPVASLFGAARHDATERQRLLDMLDLAAVMVRDLDGSIHFWSEGCQRLYGWTAAQAVGQSSHRLLQTVFPVKLADIEATLLRHGEWTGELRQRTLAGEERIVRARKVLRHDDNGRALVMENVTDITAQSRAEAALGVSEARLQTLVATAADGIIVAHADGTINFINPAGLRMFGYDRPEELIGRDLGVLMPASEAARHGRYVAAHRAGAPPRVIGVQGRDLVGQRRDGSTFPIELSVNSSVKGEVPGLIGIVRDATARRRAEQALRDSEARLRLVQQIGGIGATDRLVSQDVVALVSEQFASLYGLPAGQTHISLAAWYALVHPDDREWLAERMRDVQERGDAVTAEFRIQRADGSVRWISMRAEAFLGQDGKPERVVTAQQDITEIVAAREAQAAYQVELERRVAERTASLAEAEAQFRSLFDSQFQFVGLLTPDGTVLRANRTALEAGGLTDADVIGRPIWATGWWPPAETEQLRAEIAAAAGGALVRREVEIRGADGRGIWIDFSLNPVSDPATGQVKWIIAEGRDLTERRNLAEKLAQAQKVQALGLLAGGIAHDFNNILQSVSAAAGLIERRPEDHERTRRLARSTIHAAARGASITQRLLTFARRGELRTEVIATADLLTNISDMLGHTLGATLAIRASAPAGLPPLLADRGQLETALINLGTNARDAMPEGGTLTLSAAALHVAEGQAHPAGLAPGRYVRLDVTDSGAGMDAATQARVTEPFFTTKPPGQGTGLGLAMVKGFADQSGGALEITSALGAGTTVSLWLRQATPDGPRGDAGNVTDKPPGASSARILLVDDDELVCETLAAQVEDMGYTPLVARSGQAALALLEAGETVDVLVSDLSMPGTNGVATIQRARALRPGLPCFLLTGYAGDRTGLADETSFTLIRKPVSSRALAAHIEAGLVAAKP